MYIGIILRPIYIEFVRRVWKWSFIEVVNKFIT